MKKLVVLGTLFACGQALADSVSWTGPYMGAFVGVGRQDVRSDAFAERGAMGAGIGAVQASNAMVGSMTYSESMHKYRALPGVYAGYLWSQGPVLYGFEADLQGSSKLRSSGSNSTRLQSFSNDQVYSYEQKIKLDALASLRGRLGYVHDNKWLLYVTAGVAHAKVSTRLSSISPLLGPAAPTPIFVTSTNRSSKSKIGWVAGTGGEVAIARQLRLRVEYLYFDIRTRVDSQSVVLHSTGELFTSANGRVKNKITNSIVRVGLTYAF